MDDLEALYRAIVAQPAEDTPRLEYADLLDERAWPGDAQRARFVRDQIELARIGAPYPTVTGPVRSRTFDTFEVGVDSEFPVPVVGSRIDLNPAHGMFALRGELKGLVVREVRNASSDLYQLVLERDEHAGPYPHARVQELRARNRADFVYRILPDRDSLGLNLQEWVELQHLWFNPPPVLTQFEFVDVTGRDGFASNPRVEFTLHSDGDCRFECLYLRGFPSDLSAKPRPTLDPRPGIYFDVWCVVAKLLTTALPLTCVTLLDVPVPVRHQIITNTKYTFGQSYASPDWPRASVVLGPVEYGNLDGSGRIEEVVTRRLLSLAWPTVSEWRLPQYDPVPDGAEEETFEDENAYDSGSWDEIDLGEEQPEVP